MGPDPSGHHVFIHDWLPCYDIDGACTSSVRVRHSIVAREILGHMVTKVEKEKWADMRMAHLGLLQNVVSRMASNSASVKTYCISIVSAFIGLSVTVAKPDIMNFVVPIITILAFLDAQYLRLERAFRAQYNSVRQDPLDNEPDFLVTPSFIAGSGLWEVFWSWSIWLFYVPLVFIAVTIGQLAG